MLVNKASEITQSSLTCSEAAPRMGLDQTDQTLRSQPAGAVMLRVGSSANGLSSDLARRHLREIGANPLVDRGQPTTARPLLGQFESPLVLILTFGVIVSLVLTEWER